MTTVPYTFDNEDSLSQLDANFAVTSPTAVIL